MLALESYVFGEGFGVFPGYLPDPPRIGTEGRKLEDSYRGAIRPPQYQKPPLCLVFGKIDTVAIGQP